MLQVRLEQENPYYYGQKEKLGQTDTQYTLIEEYLNKLQQVFEWMDQDIYNSVKAKVISTVRQVKENVKIKYVIAACCFNQIKMMDGISQTDCNQTLKNIFNLKSRKLLKYLRMIGQEQTNDKLLLQLPNYQERIKKYFYGQGQSLLLKMKNSQNSYKEIIESVLEENYQIIRNLYRMDIVKQFCESKRPSRLVINMGYLVFQIQDLFILPGDYAKIFKISINSLRYFTKGLVNQLYEFIIKLYPQPDSQCNNKLISQSQTFLEEIEEKREESCSYMSEGENKKMQMIREFLKDFDIIQFLFIDTQEEDDIINELQELL